MLGDFKVTDYEFATALDVSIDPRLRTKMMPKNAKKFVKFSPGEELKKQDSQSKLMWQKTKKDMKTDSTYLFLENIFSLGKKFNISFIILYN